MFSWFFALNFSLYTRGELDEKYWKFVKAHIIPHFFFVTTKQTWNHLGTSYFMLIV
jgi:hypothetical protein